MCALSAEATAPGGKGTGEGSDEDDDVQPGQASLTAEQGLKHLLLTVDVERLYRQVLGLHFITVTYCQIGSAQLNLGMSHWLAFRSSH